MPLTNSQLQTLKADIDANTDPTFVTYRTAGATGLMADWYNAPQSPAETAWMSAADRRTIDSAPSYAAFDSIVAGKRDAWSLFLDGAPRDFTTNKARKVVTDVWGASSSNSTEAFAIYSAVTRNITRAEKLLGGTNTATEGSGTGTVTAKRLNWEGSISSEDVIRALSA